MKMLSAARALKEAVGDGVARQPILTFWDSLDPAMSRHTRERRVNVGDRRCRVPPEARGKASIAPPSVDVGHLVDIGDVNSAWRDWQLSCRLSTVAAEGERRCRCSGGGRDSSEGALRPAAERAEAEAKPHNARVALRGRRAFHVAHFTPSLACNGLRHEVDESRTQSDGVSCWTA